METKNRSLAGVFLSGALAATVLSGYFLFGSRNAKRNRIKVEDFIEDAKAEVVTKMKKIKRLSRDKYYEIVDSVSNEYSKIKTIGIEKASELRDELRSKWEEIEIESIKEDK